MIARPRSFRTVFALPAAVLTAALAASGALAQTFPSHPLTLINTTSPGIPITVMHRTMAEEWGKRLGQPVVMDQRTGAAGRLGLQALARAKGDGHMLTALHSGLAISLVLIEPDTFDMRPDRDYTPVAFSFYTPVVIVAHPSVPFRDIKGLVAYAKANPGKLNFGNTGVGSGGHMSAELFRRTAGIDLLHVPYKDNPTTAVLSGELHLLGTSAGTGKPLIESGRLVALATTGPVRWSEFPNVPTMQEQGITNYEQSFWFGVAAPAQIPPEVLQKLSGVINETLKTPEVAKQIQTYGAIQNIMSPKGFSDYIRADLERYGPVVKSLGIKPGV